MEAAIVSLAIERIADLLIQKAIFLNDVKDQVGRLKDELERMQSFLKDVDRKKDKDERLRTQVKQIQVLVYDAEDAIDSFILKVAHQRGHHGLMKRFKNSFTKPFHLHKVGKHVKTIQTKREDISKSLPAYGISRGGGESCNSAVNLQRDLRRSYPHVEEDVVGLEVRTMDVIHLLKKEEDRLHVLSIVGMGGLGKTTLAKKVYNHIDVKNHFNCCAWVFISQQCLPREVLHGILKMVLSLSREERERIDKLKEEELVVYLYDVLKEKKYLVVLDDIWRFEDWDGLKAAFPNGKKGSKLLFTTRNKEVALHADPYSSPLELPLLTEEESWELFKRKAILGNEMESDAWSKGFETLGKKMVRKCGRLPLAIVVLGGLLAAKKSLNEWEMVRTNMNTYLNKHQQHDHGGVKGILALSYHELPFHLKPCFLYIGQFPEDSEISKKELIRLWIAEGFVSSSTQGETCMEDIAEQYVEELLNRCLIRVVSRDYIGIGVKTFRIHDLLRDLCVSKSQEENFLRIIDKLTTNGENHSSLDLNLVAKSEIRRITIHIRESVSLEGGCPKLRSFFLFDQGGCLKELKISFKFLRVLKLWTNHSCPCEIGDLTLLRYLGLRGEKVILPQSIGNLKSLHTFVVRTGSLSVPNVTFKLEQLRHVLIVENLKDFLFRGTFELETLQQLLGTDLENIETLKFVLVKRLSEMKALLKLSNIRKLGLGFLSSEDVETFLGSLKLDRLQSFHLKLGFLDVTFPNLKPLSRCHSLSKLRLDGKIQEDPNSHHCLKFLPENIVKLTLEDSGMTKDPMIILEKLPQLRSLTLGVGSYEGTKLCCSMDGFPQLDYLNFKQLRFEEWEIEEGAMPRLRVLYLCDIRKLRMFPEGLKYITTLQQLNFILCKSSLAERIQVIDGREGEDYYKVRHIPSITIEGLYRTIE